MISSAIFSTDAERKYRYSLTRIWHDLVPEPRLVAFVGLNPSTADERQDDPTIRRCIAFARGWGYDGLEMLNAYAYRATNPRRLLEQADAVGPRNDLVIAARAEHAALVVLCWGTKVEYAREGRLLDGPLRLHDLHALKLTKFGHPAHPLYLAKALRPIRVSRDRPGIAMLVAA